MAADLQFGRGMRSRTGHDGIIGDHRAEAFAAKEVRTTMYS